MSVTGTGNNPKVHSPTLVRIFTDVDGDKKVDQIFVDQKYLKPLNNCDTFTIAPSIWQDISDASPPPNKADAKAPANGKQPATGNTKAPANEKQSATCDTENEEPANGENQPAVAPPTTAEKKKQLQILKEQFGDLAKREENTKHGGKSDLLSTKYLQELANKPLVNGEDHMWQNMAKALNNGGLLPELDRVQKDGTLAGDVDERIGIDQVDFLLSQMGGAAGANIQPGNSKTLDPAAVTNLTPKKAPSDYDSFKSKYEEIQTAYNDALKSTNGNKTAAERAATKKAYGMLGDSNDQIRLNHRLNVDIRGDGPGGNYMAHRININTALDRMVNNIKAKGSDSGWRAEERAWALWLSQDGPAHEDARNLLDSDGYKDDNFAPDGWFQSGRLPGVWDSAIESAAQAASAIET